MKVYLSQEEIMKACATMISEKMGGMCQPNWDELMFEVIDDDGNYIMYQSVEIYSDHGATP